jgi:putative heme-binding domain-containing protein
MLAFRPDAAFEGPEGRELLAFADELVPLLEKEAALTLFAARRERGPQVIVLRPLRDALLYDKREFTVVAGRPVEVVFDNVDIMPHNFVLTAPGALARVGLAAEAMASDPEAWSKAFIPASDEVLAHSGLLQPGSSETLSFVAPGEPGDYPYVCTFPGHWVRMNGVMHVVDALPELQELPSAEVPVAAGGPAREFVRNWSVAELAAQLGAVDQARVEDGRRVFDAATCNSCHEVAGQGGKTGPKLAEVLGKFDREELLRQLLEPSVQISEGYESEIFLTTEGLIVAGRVVEEDTQNLYIQDDPYKDDQLILPRAEIDSRKRAEVSTMPVGLMTTFEREEIFALLAYLESLATREGTAGGD